MDFVVPGAETEPRVWCPDAAGSSNSLKLKAQVDCCLGTVHRAGRGRTDPEGGNSIHANSMLRSCRDAPDSGDLPARPSRRLDEAPLDHTAARLLGHSVWRRAAGEFPRGSIAVSAQHASRMQWEPSPGISQGPAFPGLVLVQLKEKEAKASTGGG